MQAPTRPQLAGRGKAARGMVLRRRDRDLPRGFGRLVLSVLVVLLVLHVAAVTVQAWQSASVAPLLALATGSDNLLTYLVGGLSLAVTLVTKRQVSRTEALAGRVGPSAVLTRLDALAGDLQTHLASQSAQSVTVAATAAHLAALTTVVEGIVDALATTPAPVGPAGGGRYRAATGATPVAEPSPEPGGEDSCAGRVSPPWDWIVSATQHGAGA